MSENMQIWNQVKSTDPKYTKRTNNGRYDFTAIDPQYQLMQATQLWGPYGRAWGLRELRWETLPTEPPTLMLQARFFYPSNEHHGRIIDEFEVAADMKLKPGDDCCKKLMTSARSKALSFLGFNADVFLGSFDDNHYVQDAKIRFGNQSEFMVQALAKVRTAKTAETLDKCLARANELIANETIPASSGADLLDAIEEKKRELGVEG